jgi:hypothetical protein
MRIWACATVLAATTTTTRADDLIASGSAADHALVVERVSAAKLELVYQEPLFDRFDSTGKLGALSWAWSDRKTLWVLRKDGTRLFVARVIDLMAEPAREATLADFKLRREPKPVFEAAARSAPCAVGTIASRPARERDSTGRHREPARRMELRRHARRAGPPAERGSSTPVVMPPSFSLTAAIRMSICDLTSLSRSTPPAFRCSR